jgi:hypothetical protein
LWISPLKWCAGKLNGLAKAAANRIRRDPQLQAWGRGDDEVGGGVRRESAQMTSSLSIAASADYGCG